MKILHKRGTTSAVNSYAGSVGEIAVDTDKSTVVVQNGTAGGVALAKATTKIIAGDGISITGNNTLGEDITVAFSGGKLTDNMHVYVDPDNGSNSNTGADASHAVKTIAYAIKLCRSSGGENYIHLKGGSSASASVVYSSLNVTQGQFSIYTSGHVTFNSFIVENGSVSLLAESDGSAVYHATNHMRVRYNSSLIIGNTTTVDIPSYALYIYASSCQNNGTIKCGKLHIARAASFIMPDVSSGVTPQLLVTPDSAYSDTYAGWIWVNNGSVMEVTGQKIQASVIYVRRCSCLYISPITLQVASRITAIFSSMVQIGGSTEDNAITVTVQSLRVETNSTILVSGSPTTINMTNSDHEECVTCDTNGVFECSDKVTFNIKGNSDTVTAGFKATAGGVVYIHGSSTTVKVSGKFSNALFVLYRNGTGTILDSNFTGSQTAGAHYNVNWNSVFYVHSSVWTNVSIPSSASDTVGTKGSNYVGA